MAAVTIDISPQLYESGTLGAYAASGWLPGQIPDGAPKGSPVDTDSIAGGKVTFDLPVGEYWVTKTTAPFRYVSVIVAAAKSSGGGGLPEYPSVPPEGYAYFLILRNGELEWMDMGV